MDLAVGVVEIDGTKERMAREVIGNRVGVLKTTDGSRAMTDPRKPADGENTTMTSVVLMIIAAETEVVVVVGAMIHGKAGDEETEALEEDRGEDHQLQEWQEERMGRTVLGTVPRLGFVRNDNTECNKAEWGHIMDLLVVETGNSKEAKAEVGKGADNS